MPSTSWSADVRITSTYVENTKPYHYTYKYAEDHLHIRGEYSNAAFLLIVMLGSPPHTWRIQFAIMQSKKAIRITSTYVENTYFY